ncbi:MAG: class I SAM-dependent methyltransferase [candidate division FCPU426 bacterium]
MPEILQPGIPFVRPPERSLAQQIKELTEAVELYKNLLRKARQEQARNGAMQAFPPGHFYSPIPDLNEVKAHAGEIFNISRRELPGLDLREQGQVALLAALAPYYQELPFGETAQAGLRYFYQNPAYSYTDGIFLYCLLRHLRPKRVIEVGSGYSSCVTLDTNERFFENQIACTFIEPYPELLHSLLKPGDRERVEILPLPLQRVPPDRFKALAAGDVLFIDSTHVSKVHSDVNYILFEILPALAPGVYIHFHDVFYPFEYPAEWIFEGRAWNEDYMLRAFLLFNSAFRIELFSTFLGHFHAEYFRQHMPLCERNFGGNLWLSKQT